MSAVGGHQQHFSIRHQHQQQQGSAAGCALPQRTCGSLFKRLLRGSFAAARARSSRRAPHHSSTFCCCPPWPPLGTVPLLLPPLARPRSSSIDQGPLPDHNGHHLVDAGADSYHSSGYRRAEAAQRDPVSQGRAGAGAKLFPTPHAHPRPPRRRVQPNNVKNDTLRLMLVQLVSGGARRGRCGRRSALRALLSAAA